VDQRPLTPAEATLLLAPTDRTATKCVEAGLLSLLGAERIAFEKPPGRFKQSALVLNLSLRTAAPLPAHLLALERALIAHAKGNRLLSSEVCGALQKRFGLGFGRYLRDEVAPGLIAADLLARRESKWLGLITRVTYHRTSKGDKFIAPLQRIMTEVEDLPSLLASDPQKAIQLARSAGVLLIMSPKARRQIPQLRKLLSASGSDVPAVSGLPIDADRRPDADQAFEFGDLGVSLEAAILLEGLEAVGDFTSGGDSSSSDGGDGGGGGGD
jgi:hypothetical protein